MLVTSEVDAVALRSPTSLKSDEFLNGGKGAWHTRPTLSPVYRDDPIFSAPIWDATLLVADTTLLDNSDGQAT